MKKGFTLIELVSVLTILAIIGLIVTTIVVGVIKDMKEDTDKISIKSYTNSIVYAVEVFEKENDNQIPTWCTIKDGVIFFDNNYDNKYNDSELLCSVDCDSTECIKNFITYDNIKNDNNEVNCKKIVINEDGSVEVSQCTVLDREIKDYSYKTSVVSED